MRLPWSRPDHTECSERYMQAMEELAIQITRASQARSEVERLGKDLAQIRAALNEVAVYEGLVDVSPTAMLVSELVRDHEELEARINAVLLLIAALKGDSYPGISDLRDGINEIARLLQGGSRVPDSPGSLGS